MGLPHIEWEALNSFKVFSFFLYSILLLFVYLIKLVINVFLLLNNSIYFS